MKIEPVPASRIDEVMRIYDTFDRPRDPPLPTEAARGTLQHIRAQSGEVFAAMVDGAIVGTYTIYICHNLTRAGRPFAVVENVICAPSYRRQGVGTALMEHAKSYAGSQGCFKITLQSGAKREATRSFYESCGFVGDKWGYQIRFDA
jgi:GNAT superfamily N-acetyltransferase